MHFKVESALFLKKIAAGNVKLLKDMDIPGGDYAVSVKVRNSLKVHIVDNTIKVYLNDPRVVDIEFTDSDAPLLSGGVGFATENIEARFDDIAVLLDPPDPASEIIR